MMRVAVLTDNDFAKVNGVTTTLRAVLRHVPPDLHVRVYTASALDRDTPEYRAFAAPGVGLPWSRDMRVHWPGLRRLEEAIRADGADLVHITTPGPVGLAGRRIARRLGLPLVGSYHTHFGAYTEELSGSAGLGRLMDRYLHWVYGRCERLFVPSEATAAMLVHQGFAAGRLHRWSRGVDTAVFEPGRRSEVLRAGWAVSDARPAVLYAGRLSREKGLALLRPIEAVLRAHGVLHRFVLAGDGPMRGEFDSTWTDGLVLGPVAHEEMATVMASADVFVFPSATDSLGNVVLEAQAAGLPVVVADRGGPAENLRPDVSGFICQAGNGLEFAARVSVLLRDAARRRAMGVAARDYARSRSWQASLDPLFGAWREVVRARAARRATMRVLAGAAPLR